MEQVYREYMEQEYLKQACAIPIRPSIIIAIPSAGLRGPLGGTIPPAAVVSGLQLPKLTPLYHRNMTLLW